MLDPMAIALSTEFEKIAFVAKTPRMKVELHHGSSKEDKDWGAFERNLKDPAFRKELLNHVGSDKQLKRYTKTMGSYLDSKSIAAVAPSRTTKGKEYEIRRLPSGRLGCSCKDWQYHHSVRNSDCAHVKAVKAILQRGLVKQSGKEMYPIYAGLVLAGMEHKSKKNLEKGKQMEMIRDRLRET